MPRPSARLAKALTALATREPELHKLITEYITSLRFENARNRNQLEVAATRIQRLEQEGTTR